MVRAECAQFYRADHPEQPDTAITNDTTMSLESAVDMRDYEDMKKLGSSQCSEIFSRHPVETIGFTARNAGFVIMIDRYRYMCGTATDEARRPYSDGKRASPPHGDGFMNDASGASARECSYQY